MNRFFLLAVIFFIPIASYTQDLNLNDVEGRKRFLIDSMASWAVSASLEDILNSDGYGGGKYGAYPAMALFEIGEIEKARALASRQAEGGAAMFREFGTMSLYMKYNHIYTNELKQQIKENQLNSDFFQAATNRYPGNISQSHRNSNIGGASENHKLMYSAAAYLAGIAWPDEYPKEWFNAGYNHLMYWFNTITRIGFWEEDSPTYMIHHMGPILSVYEFAPEGSEMKKRAKMVLDWYFLSVAGEYLKGYWITPAARDYNPLYGVENSAESTVLMWLYFGDTDAIPYPHMRNAMYEWKAAIHFAVSDYKIPEIILRIATDRNQSYVHKEFMAKNPMQPKEYCYITPFYGVASILHENGAPPDDMTRWKVQWVPVNSGMEPTTFFMKHPVRSQEWKVWRGASAYEQTIQHEGTLLAIYNIPKGEMNFIDGPFNPRAYKIIKEKDEWLFFHTGNMLMAIRAANGLKTENKQRRLGFHSKLQMIKALRSEGSKNALVVHTEDAEKYPGNHTEQLNTFINDILTKSTLNLEHLLSDSPSVSFTTPDGDKLSITFDGDKKINDENLISDNYPMFANPWMHQEINKGILTLKHSGEVWIYDFNNWEINSYSQKKFTL